MSYPKPQDDDFMEKLFKHKEFFQARIEEKKKDSSKENFSFLTQKILNSKKLILHSYQLFVQNYINPSTPYKRLLMKWMTGIGKTMGSLAVAAPFITYYKKYYDMNPNKSPYVIVIGFTKRVFQRDLLRFPEFGFISREEIVEHKRLINIAEYGSESDKKKLIEFETNIKKRLSKKKIGGFYKFFGYQEFFNRLFDINKFVAYIRKKEKGIGEEIKFSYSEILEGIQKNLVKVNYEILEMFKNSLVICDEIHNVYNSNEINNYGLALQFMLDSYDMPNLMKKYVSFPKTILNILKNSIVRTLMLSATPINNSPTEIIDLLNLLIPISQLPHNKHLDKDDFFIDQRNFKPNGLEKIQKLIKGKVSFLRDANPKYFPTKEISGEIITLPTPVFKENKDKNIYNGKTIPYLKFIRCYMSSFQYQTYKKIYTGTLPPDGHSLVDFVLPNPDSRSDEGLFRSKDIRYQLGNAPRKWKDKHQIDFIAEKNVITGDFMVQGPLLKKYSPKYSKLVENVHNIIKNDGGKIIIYHHYVKNSGVLFIQELLRKNGIIDEFATPIKTTLCAICGKPHFGSMGNKDGKKHEFIPVKMIMAHGDMDRNSMDRSIDKFNHPDNSLGHQYYILVGSKIIKESVDFKDVQNLEVMTVPVNISQLIQIIGRPVRKNSHIELPIEKRHVNINLYVSSLPKGSAQSKKELSYEENRYYEKLKDYMVIQKIDSVFNSEAIDAYTHREIIMPPGSKEKYQKMTQYEKGLNILYFEPSFKGYGKGISLDKLRKTTFRAYHSSSEIKLIIHIIKRLFIEQSSAWDYDQLWNAVKNPPFAVEVNSNLFLEENFIMALHFLTLKPQKNIDIYHTDKSESDIDRLFDPDDKKIFTPSGQECVIYYINGIYLMLPIHRHIGEKKQKYVQKKYAKGDPLGFDAEQYQGTPVLDTDSWYRYPKYLPNTRFNISQYLYASKASYDQMKIKFFNKYKNVSIEEIPTTVELYGFDFHIQFVEDAIKYSFNVLTDANYPISEYNDFYFKMLYFYDRMELIVYAIHLEDHPVLLDKYKPFLDMSNRKKISKEDRFNAFLMTSITKASAPKFNLDRLNKYIDDNKHKYSSGKKERKLVKIPPKMLPIGHFLSSPNVYSNKAPKLYFPSSKSKKEKKQEDEKITEGEKKDWFSADEFVESYSPTTDVENDKIIGYYEKNISGIDLKFKLRTPKQKIEKHVDTRMIERGAACSTKKKEELVDVLKLLNIKAGGSIKNICTSIKITLMKLELDERRKFKHMTPEERRKKKRVRWFYFHYENHM